MKRAALPARAGIAPWGFWSLDPERDGARLQLVAELAAVSRSDASAARLLRAIEQHPLPARSGVRERPAA